MAIYFYKEFGELGYLASYSLHGFYKDGIYWRTTEHFYQAHKFEDEQVRQRIINAQTPKEASRIGRSKEYKIKDNWDDIRAEVTYEAVLLKFQEHADIREKLCSTGEEEIIEKTTKENYWGCGPKCDGTNMYGKILCQVREVLKDYR